MVGKRKLSMLLCTVLIGGVLAGCGNSAANVVNLRDKEKNKNFKKTLDNTAKICSLPVDITFTGRNFHESYKNFINYFKTN